MRNRIESWSGNNLAYQDRTKKIPEQRCTWLEKTKNTTQVDGYNRISFTYKKYSSPKLF